jgi:hypothetical protein
MSQGCVVLSARLPTNVLYQSSPVIQFEKWDSLHSILSDLLNHPYRLAKISQSTYEWWNRVLSPEAMAFRVVNLLINNK